MGDNLFLRGELLLLHLKYNTQVQFVGSAGLHWNYPRGSNLLCIRQVRMNFQFNEQYEFIMVTSNAAQVWYNTETNLKQCLDIKRIKQVHRVQRLNVNQLLFVVIPLLTPCYGNADNSRENSNSGKEIFLSIWRDKMQHKGGSQVTHVFILRIMPFFNSLFSREWRLPGDNCNRIYIHTFHGQMLN